MVRFNGERLAPSFLTRRQKTNTNFLPRLDGLMGIVIDSLTAEELKFLVFCVLFSDLRLLLFNSVLQRPESSFLAGYSGEKGKNKGLRVCVSFLFSSSKIE